MKKKFFEKIKELKYKKDYIISNAYGLTGYGDNDKAHNYMVDITLIVSQWANLLTARQFLYGENFKEEVASANALLAGNFIEPGEAMDAVIKDMINHSRTIFILRNNWPELDLDLRNGKI